MYQVTMLNANQIELLEEKMNTWLKEHAQLNIVDVKFNSNMVENHSIEYIAIMIYQV